MSTPQTAQSLQPDASVELFTLDATSIGGPIYYFVQGKHGDGDPIVFNGVTYQALDIEFEGLEVTGTGALPTPRIRLSNSDGVVQSIINTWGDLVGCDLYRVRTFRCHLDGEADADPTAFFGPDQFRFAQKTTQNPIYFEWELSAAIDQEGKMLPGRQIIRDTCLWRYRVWNGTSFDYTKALCPYTGSNYFDINDQPVANPEDDYPSRRLGCCKARFGENAPLPFGGFPGVGRMR